ncbi:hypothetical protein N7497_012191 [Penicillium chrysogenum]|nr:hypothetical protein N7497_012191 [Penicillium chrysogenum]
MLLNPSPWDHLPFEDMIDESTTLSWLRKTLEGMNLSLDNIIIFDILPMLRESLRRDVLREGSEKLMN